MRMHIDIPTYGNAALKYISNLRILHVTAKHDLQGNLTVNIGSEQHSNDWTHRYVLGKVWLLLRE